MTRVLKTSGFLGLAVMMLVGLRQHMLMATTGEVPAWMIGGHAHLGTISILAIATGFAVDAFGMTGRLRALTTGLFLIGQWLLPLSVWVGFGAGVTILLPAIYVWGTCLLVSMLVLAWQAWTTPPAGGGPPSVAATADD